MPIPGAYMPQGDMDSYAEAMQQAPVPQSLHTQTVFNAAATDFTRKAMRAAPDMLYQMGRLVFNTNDDPDEAAQTPEHIWQNHEDLDTQTLNSRFGVDGYLRFNEPTTAEDAAWRSEQAKRQQFQDQVFAATKPQPLTDFGLSLAGSLVDPLGLATMVGTGGLGEIANLGRTGEAAAETANAISRLGRVANAARVPLEGALSNAGYIGANYALSKDVGDDYSAIDAMRDLAAGAILHSSLHALGAGLRMARDAWGDPAGRINPNTPTGKMGDQGDLFPSMVDPRSVPEAVDNLTPAARQGAFVKGVEDMANDRPIDVGDYVDRENNPPTLERLNETSAEAAIPSFRPLADDTAITTRGTEVPVRYGLAELSDLTTSHDDNLATNPNYPQELQPRDRARAGAQANNYRLESELNPKLLMSDTGAGQGAPIVAPNGVVESGNGRTIALRRSAAKGGEAYGRYRAELEARGFDTSGFKNPVLVRMRTEPMEGASRAALAREMNADVTERMGPVEQAMADAQRMPDQALHSIPEGKGITTDRDFTRAFIGAAAPDQVNTMANADGTLSPEGARRVKAAVLARAYEDPSLVGQMFEGEETPVRQLSEGLAEAAPMWAKMRAAAKAGQIPAELDLTGPLRAAMDLVRIARQQGVSLGEFVAERIGQKDIFGGEAISAQTEALLRLMYRDKGLTRPESAETIAQALKEYARQALEVTPGENLFGETAGENTAREILANVAEKYAGKDTGAAAATRRAPGKSKPPVEPGPTVVDVSELGGSGERSGDEGVSSGVGEQSGDDSPGERAEAESGAASAQRIIASDPELKALADDNARVASAYDLEGEKLPPAQDPENIAKAIDAVAQCAIGAAEEIL